MRRTSIAHVAGIVLAACLSSDARAHELSLDDRVKAQEAIERVYYSHQVGATKPFEEAVPGHVLERKVQVYLQQSAALEQIWHSPITADMLARELERMARGTRMPERLREIFAALDSDPFLVQECLARAVLADRLTRGLYAFDRRFHATAARAAESIRAALASGELDPRRNHPLRTEREVVENRVPHAMGQVADLAEERDAFHVRVVLEQAEARLRIADYRVEKTPWDTWWAAASPRLSAASIAAVAANDSSLPDVLGDSPGFPCSGDDTWDNGSLDDVPEPRQYHTAVWTGSLMVVWGGYGTYSGSAYLATGGRYDPATDTWTPVSTVGAPSPRALHTAVWTGSRMVVWGGLDVANSRLDTGGRYDPATDTWTPTSNVAAPSGRSGHTAVSTGNLMIVWGGIGSGGNLATGGRYDAASDSWTPTATAGAPSPRTEHTAIWTGTRMIVWGGPDAASVDTGGRYDPASDSWTPTSTAAAPLDAYLHTAIWTGSRMLVWAAFSGGRYDPGTDTWTPVSTAGAPEPRMQHTAVWTGNLMVVWGGNDTEWNFDTGGRYDPTTDTWMATSTAGAPEGRSLHTAVWTGSAMVVWGGGFDTGGRYDPTIDTWTPTAVSPIGAPAGASRHTAVWTGAHMVVWGGSNGSSTVNTGGRYDPAIDTWTPTSTVNAPLARERHTAVWTGSLMVVWGGVHGAFLNTGGRYDPATDTWTPTSTVAAPSGRSRHTAVWTGDRMIVWGGITNPNTGGRYDPLTDTWTPTSMAGAPAGRDSHTAVWTGSRMVIWGGSQTGSSFINTGGCYDPATDSWVPTSLLGAPDGRLGHTAVWTGNRMVVWGGYRGAYLKSGGRYDPVADAWTATSLVGAPGARQRHSSVWTNSEMVIWGGMNGPLAGGGGRYDPAADTWASLSTIGAPTRRTDHTAIWSGSLMMVWGGSQGHSTTHGGGRYALGTAVDDDGDGYSECGGDCNDGNASIHPGAEELCEGLDNDCNGVVDEAFPAPPPTEQLRFGADKETLIWSAALGTDSYDVVKGELVSLVSSGGDFAASLRGCVENDTDDAAAADAELPFIADGFYYLVRARAACRNGTYNTDDPSQQGDRDAEIAASSVRCP